MSIKYRPEIDGLRAIAVLLVVLYHLEIPFITGGFIGVDVFFVISGYLITSILLKDIKNNEYSLLRFYERRIKRILPALFAVITISLVAAWFILFPADFKYFGRSVAATTIFISNFLFHDESGYFEVSARLVPLLHTWSLAVEEQFYILFPLYLFAIKKLNVNKQFLITLILALASLALSIWAVYNGKESAAFYWLPSRACELLAGSLLAMNVFKATFVTERIKTVIRKIDLGLIGILVIFASSFLLTPDSFFPGVNALYPVIGAIMILLASNASSISYKALTFKPLVFIGKISYSLYLWHWPIICFYSYAFGETISPLAGLLILTLSFGMSVISYYCIEQPVRRSSLPRRTIFLTAICASITLFSIGLFISQNDGIKGRFPASVEKLAEMKDLELRNPIEFLGYDYGEYSNWLGSNQKQPQFLVWGDSHAGAAYPGLDSLANEYGITGYLIGNSACLPALTNILGGNCKPTNESAIEVLKTTPSITHVILITRWGMYNDHIQKFGTHKKEPHMDAYYLDQTLSFLESLGKKVYIVQSLPELSIDSITQTLARAEYFSSHNADPRISRGEYELQQKEPMALINKMRETHNFTILSPKEILCPNDICIVQKNDKSLYHDNDHYSYDGSLYVKDMYRPIFDDLAK